MKVGRVIINQWFDVDLVPFVRVAQERSTARAKRYKRAKDDLAHLLMLSAPVRLDIFPFETWHLRLVVERPRRVDTRETIAEGRTGWAAMRQIRSDIFHRVSNCLGQNGDVDNYAKTVLDAATGVLWFDDELVSSIGCLVRRDVDRPRVHVLAIVEVQP